jgi:hypothetical protein
MPIARRVRDGMAWIEFTIAGIAGALPGMPLTQTPIGHSPIGGSRNKWECPARDKTMRRVPTVVDAGLATTAAIEARRSFAAMP